MKKKTTVLLGILFLLSAQIGMAAEKSKWLIQPQLTTFSQFKHFALDKDKVTGAISYVKKDGLYYKLTQPLEGDSTKVCFGIGALSGSKENTGVACTLKLMNQKNCEKLSVDKCSADNSIVPNS